VFEGWANRDSRLNARVKMYQIFEYNISSLATYTAQRGALFRSLGALFRSLGAERK
jgi:hypothetical protein